MARVHVVQNELKSSANLRTLWKNLNHSLHHQKRDNFTNEKSVSIAQSFNTYFMDEIKHIHLNIKSFNNSHHSLFTHNQQFRRGHFIRHIIKSSNSRARKHQPSTLFHIKFSSTALNLFQQQSPISPTYH